VFARASRLTGTVFLALSQVIVTAHWHCSLALLIGASLMIPLGIVGAAVVTVVVRPIASRRYKQVFALISGALAGSGGIDKRSGS
jgi:hypothetical protein